MKFRKKPTIIDAEQYKLGMEDGFVTRYIDKDDKNITWGIPASDDEIPIEIPYITIVAGGKQLISIGDWILIHKNNSRSVISNKKFVKMYEKVE